MKRLILTFTSTVVALAQPSSLPNAQTILERSGKATGQDALRSITTQKLVGTLSIPATGISGSIVSYQGRRGEMYQVVEIPGAGKTEVGNNGDVEWERSTLTGPKVRRVAAEPGDLLQPDPLSLAFSNPFSKVETAGLDRVNRKPCFLVNQWTSSNTMLTICYDRETFLPVQLKMNAAGKPITMILGDYRPVGSAKMPFLLETEIMGQTIRVQVDSITLNEPLPPEALQLPEEIEKLAYQRVPPEIREVEVDKERPILRHRTAPAPQKKR